MVVNLHLKKCVTKILNLNVCKEKFIPLLSNLEMTWQYFCLSLFAGFFDEY